MNKIIIMCGKARSGKNTCVDLIEKIIKEQKKYNPKNINYVVQKFSFASKLKEMCSDLFGWEYGDKELYYNEDGTLDKMRGRAVLQTVGQHMRKIKINVWSNYVRKDIEQYLLSCSSAKIPAICVIDDARRIDEIEEIEKIKDYEIIKIKIFRNEELKLSDESETGLDNYDKFTYVISNNGTIDELKNKLLEKLVEKEICLK